MAACGSPVTIDLSSDSEDAGKIHAEDARENDVFTLDWADDDDEIPPFDPMEWMNEPHIEEGGSDSSDTIVVTSEEVQKMISDVESSPEKSNPEEESSRRRISDAESTPEKSGGESEAKKAKDKAPQARNRSEKQRLREEKKAEELKRKRMKAATALKQRILKPEENIKLLTVRIDTRIVNSEYGGKVIASLNESGLRYAVEDQEKPFTILWSKKVQDVIAADDGVVCRDVGDKEESQLLYLVTRDKAARLVASNELLTHVETIKSVYPDKTVTVVLSGMQGYFSEQKKRLKGDNGSRKRVEKQCNDAEVTKEQLQTALIELQLLGKCKHWFVETPDEFSFLVTSVTKSLSQVDYRAERGKNDDLELEWYAKADSRNCVKVDKGGSGLLELWRRQICQFTAIGSDVANAIASNFRSPQALLERYRRCGSEDEAKLCLQNVQMRRDAGILSATRRVGPETSKKLYNFFTSDNPHLEL